MPELRRMRDGLVRQVKGTRTRIHLAIRIVAAVVLTLNAASVCDTLAALPLPPKLKPATQEAFDRYMKLTEERNEAELKRGSALLWVDGLPETQRTEAFAALKRGEVQMRKLETRDDERSIPCPSGIIHHWIGLVFIPGATMEDALAVLEDYDKHAIYFAPDVERSKIEAHDGGHFRVFLRFRRHKIITVVLDTEHEVQYFHDGAGRAHSRSSAVRVAEVENAGKSDEREKTPGDDGGFLWRMETWWRMLEGNDGVYVQCEVVSLTRDIPTGLGWMIGPFVTSIPRETLTATLVGTRKAVQGRVSKH